MSTKWVAMVPDTYKCISCNQYGKHWIMQCPLISSAKNEETESMSINHQKNKYLESLINLKIDGMDPKSRAKVIGYIKQVQNNHLPDYRANTFYLIPDEIYDLCSLYIHIPFGSDEQKNDDIPRFIQGLYHSNPASQYECIKHYRSLSTKPNNPPIRQIIDSGVIPRVIQLSQDHSHPHLQYEALWTLLSVANGPPQAIAYLIRNNAHKCLISLLISSQLYEIKDQAMYVRHIFSLF